MEHGGFPLVLGWSERKWPAGGRTVPRSVQECELTVRGIYIPQILGGEINLRTSPVNMSFSLTPICELFNQLTENYARLTNLSRIQTLNKQTVVAWFKKYDKAIPRRGPEAVA